MFEQQQNHISKEQRKLLVFFFFFFPNIDTMQQILKCFTSKRIPLYFLLQKPQLTSRNNLHPPNSTSNYLRWESDFHIRVNSRLHRRGSAYTRGGMQPQRSQQTLWLCAAHCQSSLVHRSCSRPRSGVEAQGEWTHCCTWENKGESRAAASPPDARRCSHCQGGTPAGTRGTWTPCDLPEHTPVQRRAQGRHVNMSITSHIAEHHISSWGGDSAASSLFYNDPRTGCDNYQTELKARRTF